MGVLCRLAVAIGAVGVLFGCTTPRTTSPSANLPIFKDRLPERSAAAKEVEEARRILETHKEDVGVAVPRLVHVISKYPNTDASAEAHYWLGVAHFQLQSYRDAIDMFRQYLEMSPHGRYATQASQYVAELTDEYEKRYIPLDQLDERIAQLEEQLRAQPDNPEVEMELADLLWKRGNYPKAGAVYNGLVKAHPEYGSKPIVAERVEFLPSGDYVVLSPDEVQRRMIEKEPLVLVSANSFQSGRDLLTRERRFYVVSGQVKNRGDGALYGVQVTVTIYGFGNVVYDTNTYNIGRMNPGEVRAFSVQFSNFPNLEDISRFDVSPTFQR